MTLFPKYYIVQDYAIQTGLIFYEVKTSDLDTETGAEKYQLKSWSISVSRLLSFKVWGWSSNLANI